MFKFLQRRSKLTTSQIFELFFNAYLRLDDPFQSGWGSDIEDQRAICWLHNIKIIICIMSVIVVSGERMNEWSPVLKASYKRGEEVWRAFDEDDPSLKDVLIHLNCLHKSNGRIEFARLWQNLLHKSELSTDVRIYLLFAKLQEELEFLVRTLSGVRPIT
jgi:hypothetical protein